MSPRCVEDAHQAVLATAKELLEKGLVEGTSGVGSDFAGVYWYLRTN